MSISPASGAWVVVSASCAIVVLVAGPSRRPGRARRPLAMRATSRRRVQTPRRRRLARTSAIVAVALGALFEPAATIVAAIAITAVRGVRRHLVTSAHQRRRADALPDLIDLLVLTMRAGHSPAGAVAAAAEVATGPSQLALTAIVHRMRRGDRLVEAIDELRVHLGADALPVIDAVVSADRFGVAITPALDELAEEARAARRRAVAADARAIPVRLAFPLVLCVLPAFALLAVAPVLLTAWRSVSMPP